jgi:LDH2 family malate/lactate/ureidoglycolate dehydrogenase
VTFIDAGACCDVIRSTLVNLDVIPEAADHVARSLVTTSLRGVDSHGIKLFPHYVRAVRAGRITPRPNMKVTHTGDSSARVDADHAFGHYAGSIAVSEAVRLAQATGVGAVSVANSTHFGAAAYFALQAASQNCIGLAFTNADALVKAHAARMSFFGTNPICFAAPLEDEEPFCLDMATSIVSWNKILDFRARRSPIPDDWAFDVEGQSVSDPDHAVSLSPIGSYKGFGLGMMVDILCALLAGGPVSKDLLPMYSSPIEAKRRISHFFLALSIRHFTDPQLFRSSLQLLVNQIRQLPSSDPATPVMVAGDPEKQTFVNRTKSGIPLDETQFSALLAANPAFAGAVRA